MASLRVGGSIRVPGDKSISHRALLLAALAEGESQLRGLLVSGDVAATASVLREMSVELAPLSALVSIRGRGLRGLRAPGAALDCGNSGTTARLVAGIVAAHPFSATFTGDASLSRRPMHRVAEPLRSMGASVDFEREDGLPMTVHGDQLRPIDWVLPVPSAQLKGAILLAALCGGVRASVRGGGRSRDHTERMLAASGVRIEGDADMLSIEPAEEIEPLDLDVPGDPSSAAYLAALAAIADEGELEVTAVGLNPTRTTFFELLRGMGARVSSEVSAESLGEPVGIMRAGPGRLTGRAVAPEDVPELLDELPLIACLGALAEGETVITGAAELRVKESDRIAVVVQNLLSLGADAEELPDGLVVRGSDKPLRGKVRTTGDHRIAMSFAVLAQRPANDIKIDDTDCVSVSYPGFWDDLRRAAVE